MLIKFINYLYKNLIFTDRWARFADQRMGLADQENEIRRRRLKISRPLQNFLEFFKFYQILLI